jgi:hypothetical protein
MLCIAFAGCSTPTQEEPGEPSVKETATPEPTLSAEEIETKKMNAKN